MLVPADASQLDDAWSIVDRCRATLLERGIRQWDHVYPTRDVIAADIREGRLHVLVEDECVRAVVALDQRQDPEYATVPWAGAEPALVVHRLCVDPALQGHGYGARMLEDVERYARQQGFASIRLDAYSGNPPAVAMYRRRGYREAGQVFFPRRPLLFHCFELDLTSSAMPAPSASGVSN